MTVVAQDRSITRRLDGVGMEGAFSVSAAVRAHRDAGRQVLDLSIGEPGFPTPPHIIAAGIAALARGETRYAAPAGLPELRASVAAAHTARTGAPCTAEQVVVTPGAKAALLYAVLALVERGDEILIPDPNFPAYRSIAAIAGATAVPYEWVDGACNIGARLTHRTRVIVVNSPHNPTGQAFSREELERIAALACEHDLWIISDEVYAGIWYGDGEHAPSCASIAALEERLVVVDGFSKSHAMTGWRLGHCIAPAAVADALTRLAVNAHSCVAPFVQYAGIAALACPSPVPQFVSVLRPRRDLLVRGLREIPGVTCTTPQGGIFAYARFDGIDSEAFTTALLDEHGVAAVAGSAFSTAPSSHVRFSFAPTPDVLTPALSRIAACTAQFRSNS